MLLCGCLGGAPECTSARRTAGQGVRLGPRESEIPASTARGFCVLGDRLLRDAHERRAPRLDRRPEGLERLQVPAARRAPRAGVEGEEQLAVPEQRFRRDLDAALVPQSKSRRAVACLERALGLSCRDQVFGRTSHRIHGVALAWLCRPTRCSVFSLFLMSGLPSARGGQ
jgi:hypothetical protein